MKNIIFILGTLLSSILISGCASNPFIDKEPVFHVVSYDSKDYFVKDIYHDYTYLCQDGKVRNWNTDHMTSDEYVFSTEAAANSALIKYRDKLESQNNSK